MAGVELVSCVQSPVLMTVSILLGALLLVTIVIHHGRHCADMSATALPTLIQVQDAPAPTVLGT